MSVPIQTAEEARTREAFLVMMWALSYPGRPQTLPPAASAYPSNFAAIGETLLDLETSFYTPDPRLATILGSYGARPSDIASAAYHFYPTVDTAALAKLEQAHTGTFVYPDHSATLVVGCELHRGTELELSGPGIAVPSTLRVGALPREFWLMRERKRRYPLGWDVILLSGRLVAGIPRSTLVKIRDN